MVIYIYISNFANKIKGLSEKEKSYLATHACHEHLLEVYSFFSYKKVIFSLRIKVVRS